MQAGMKASAVRQSRFFDQDLALAVRRPAAGGGAAPPRGCGNRNDDRDL